MHDIAEMREKRCSGLKDIINNIGEYFAIEFKDAEHRSVVRMIRANNNVMSKDIMDKWIWENYIENYIKKNDACTVN